MPHPFTCDCENFTDKSSEINDPLPLFFPLLKVKVDESLSLDHVTRDRVKMTQGRRPPTRSHLKEVGASPGVSHLPSWEHQELQNPREKPRYRDPRES